MNLIDFTQPENKNLKYENMNPRYKEKIMNLAKNDPWYPSYHIAPKHGLLNDPNGLAYINGYYHIFYQWYPFGPVHGLKYWYHLVTKDFISFEDKGIALAPDMDADDRGCYTGMMLQEQVYYTGVHGPDKLPSVCKADFKNEKLTNKRTLFEMDSNLTTRNFRDPYVWAHNGYYYMLNGAETLDNKGVMTLHQSSDGESFEYKGLLNIQSAPEAYMFECPNYTEIEGKGLLIYSPQGMSETSKFNYRNIFSVVYSVGNRMNTQKSSFDAEEYLEVDKGFDFYAPQIFNDGKRTLLIGWLGNSKCEYPSDKNQWAHMLTIPREISIKNQRLVQKPISEMKKLRKMVVSIEKNMILESTAFEILINPAKNFKLCLQNSQGHALIFSANEKEYCLDRQQTTVPFNHQYGQQRFAKRKDSTNDITIYVDHSAIEIFCDNGETVFTGRFFIENLSSLELVGTEGTLYYLDDIRKK